MLAEVMPILAELKSWGGSEGQSGNSTVKSLSLRGVKFKAIPLQALTGPEVSRRLWLPDFKTIGT
jgi:hypothetical protein